MVKIISEGKLPELETFEATCSHCRTKFSFLRCEAKHYAGDQREPSNELHIKCPLKGCGRTVRRNLGHDSYWDNR